MEQISERAIKVDTSSKCHRIAMEVTSRICYAHDSNFVSSAYICPRYAYAWHIYQTEMCHHIEIS